MTRQTSPRQPRRRQIGLWLIGARGSVATTAICGLAAIRAGVTDATGCVTDSLDLSSAVFPGWGDFVVGGQDIAPTSLEKEAGRLAAAGVLPQSILPLIADELRAADAAIRPGYDPVTDRGPQAHAAARQIADLERFKQANDLASVVVVNVAAAEPPAADWPEYRELDALTRILASPAARSLTPSSLAIYAALQAGCPVVDFTPSPGLSLPAITELAQQRGLPYAGRDGKTGQTLLRTALAPMFAARGLRVLSWSGTNLLGGEDGANLADLGQARGEPQAKARGLTALLGPDVTAPLHVDYVPDLGERKVVWDYVSFEGFLGTRMSLQFNWDGYDAALSAPLVLDLARLVAGAHRAGETGPLSELGFFFKDPLGSTEHRLAEQAAALSQWVRRLS
jgi:myo-inositol-1-phosphate synthase